MTEPTAPDDATVTQPVPLIQLSARADVGQIFHRFVAAVTHVDPVREFLSFFQAEDGIRYHCVTGVQTCALPIYCGSHAADSPRSVGYRGGPVHPSAAGIARAPGASDRRAVGLDQLLRRAGPWLHHGRNCIAATVPFVPGTANLYLRRGAGWAPDIYRNWVLYSRKMGSP